MDASHSQRDGVIERAVQRLPPDEVRSGGWLRRKEVKVVPSKFVFTVKPPDPPAQEDLLHAAREGQANFKRKARLVACGNYAPGTGSEVTPQVLQLRHSGALWSSALRGVGC